MTRGRLGRWCVGVAYVWKSPFFVVPARDRKARLSDDDEERRRRAKGSRCVSRATRL